MSEASSARSGNFRLTASIIASAMFMEQLDATVLTTALPTMARDFGVSPAHLSAALTAYLLSLAVLIPASGVIADRYGARRVFSLAICIFLAGSVLCALAPGLPWLIAARLLQGAGGAMMVPVGRLVLLHNLDKKDLIPAMGWLLTPGLTGQILGPPLGGFIVTYLDWRWIFYINIPIGLIGLVLTWRFIADRPAQATGPFDTLGFVLSGLALSCLLFGLEGLAHANGRSLAVAAGLAVTGALAALGYGLHVRRLKGRAPILDLSLMRIPTFRLAIIAGSLTRITQGALPFLLPLMMQIGFGLSPMASGALTFSAACGFVAMKPLAAPVLKRVRLRTALIWNALASSAFYALCALFRPDWPYLAIFAVLFLAGFSLSLQITAYNAVCFEDIPPERTAAANSLFGTLQQLMLSVGICIAALALTGARLMMGHSTIGLADLSVAFLVVTGISVFAAPVNAALPKDLGRS